LNLFEISYFTKKCFHLYSFADKTPVPILMSEGWGVKSGNRTVYLCKKNPQSLDNDEAKLQKNAKMNPRLSAGLHCIECPILLDNCLGKWKQARIGNTPSSIFTSFYFSKLSISVSDILMILMKFETMCLDLNFKKSE